MIADSDYFLYPTNRISQFCILDLYYRQPSIPQNQNNWNGRIQQRPDYFTKPVFDYCELISVICWLDYIQNSNSLSVLNLSLYIRGSKTKTVSIYKYCSILSIGFSQYRNQIQNSDTEILTNSDFLGSIYIVFSEIFQTDLDRTIQKSPDCIFQRQFKYIYSGYNCQFRYRTVFEQYLIYYSDKKPYICWIPEYYCIFKYFNNFLVYYSIYSKLNNYNYYIVILNKIYYIYNPEFCRILIL